MKGIIELKNKHQGEDIYVLASGKSVDFFNEDFFDNKIVIGVNQAYKKIWWEEGSPLIVLSERLEDKLKQKVEMPIALC